MCCLLSVQKKGCCQSSGGAAHRQGQCWLGARGSIQKQVTKKKKKNPYSFQSNKQASYVFKHQKFRMKTYCLDSSKPNGVKEVLYAVSKEENLNFACLVRCFQLCAASAAAPPSEPGPDPPCNYTLHFTDVPNPTGDSTGPWPGEQRATLLTSGTLPC